MSSVDSAPVSVRLQSVSDRADLDALLRSIVSAPGSRWTRTQVLHYIPGRWRTAAEEYFEGESFRALDAMPWPPDPIEAAPLAVAMAAAQKTIGGQQLEGECEADPQDNKRLSTVEDLLARPLPGGSQDITSLFRAMRQEMREVHAKSPKNFRLSHGRCTGFSRGQYLYAFAWSSEPDQFCPGVLRLGKAQFAARVGEAAGHSGQRFHVHTDEYLGDSVSTAVFQVDPTFLLRTVYEELAHRVDTSAEPNDALVTLCGQSVFPANVAPLSGEVYNKLNAEQRRAVQVALSVRTSYVWGPPGTGKTHTVGALVRALVDKGKRVLVISPYNVAVDQAVLSAARFMENRSSEIVRIGRVDTEVRRFELDIESRLEAHAAASGVLATARQLVGSTMASYNGESVTPPATMRGCLEALGSWLTQSGRERADPVAKELDGLVGQLRRLFKAPEHDLIGSARVVCCTMALSFLLTSLRQASFDHIIIDEASVVRPPDALLAMLRGAGAAVTFFGDPKQLPAIVQSESIDCLTWLGRSPFALAGISEPHHAVGGCVMLNEQRRMAPPIRGIVSRLFYADTLRDGPNLASDGRVFVIDTFLTGARSTPKMIKLSHSKENQLHRHIVAEIVRAMVPRKPDVKVLVLSPFVAQRRGYAREPNTSRLTRHIRFETIHSSQGSEQDVVILDLVLAGSGPGTRSRMLDGSANRHLANLLNVAMSRAKHSLLIVGDLHLVRARFGGGLLERVIDEAGRAGGTLVLEKGPPVRKQFEAVL